MTTRIPIQPSDIRVGDVIRWEKDPAGEGNTQAVEWIITEYNGSTHSYNGKHYLLDRPKQAIILPDKPTLGWLTVADTTPKIGHWQQYETRHGDEYAVQAEVEFPASSVTAFTEAVAVPKSALDALRGARRLDHITRLHVLETFLRAIDNASTR